MISDLGIEFGMGNYYALILMISVQITDLM
jgi:hypothetical protein